MMHNAALYKMYQFWHSRTGVLLYKMVWTVIHLLSFIPPVILLGCLAVTYVYGVKEVCIGMLEGQLLAQTLYLLVGHAMLVLVMSTYFRAMFSRPPYVPYDWHLSPQIVRECIDCETFEKQQEILEQILLERGLKVHDRMLRGIRLCVACRLIKPDRCHHCRKCGRCNIGFDHHCPWLFNCVHANNRKLFILLCVYTFLFCGFGFITSLPLAWDFYRGLFGADDVLMPSTEVLTMIVTQTMFGLSTLALFWLQMLLVFTNRTTFELGLLWFKIGQPNPYNKGFYANFTEIFGTNMWFWFVPLTRPGDEIYLQLKAQRKFGSLV